jgi:acyl-CoA synthetase (AMP-forming)/AMP-acid ligase II
MNISELVATVASRCPAKIAVRSDAGDLTYAQLRRRFERIGGAFAAMGLRRGDRVLLAMENRAEFFELLLGCWAAGLCAVPVNAKLHHREIAYIIANCGASLAVMSPQLAEPFEKEGCRVIVVGSDAYEALLTHEPVSPAHLEPTEPAWLFYTSGTTGRPKGATLTHRNLLCMSQAYFADIDFLDEDDVNLHMAPLSHGSGLYAIPHLLRGGMQIVSPGFEFDVLARTLAAQPNVSLFAAPTMLTRILAHPQATTLVVANLKTILYGGGPMYVSDLERAIELFGPRLYQVYGQGETPMTITGLDKRSHAGGERAALLRTAGTPRTGVAVAIVDRDGRPVPAGEIGEVVTRSDCVMQGYWDNPDATASAIRNGWLYTGDVGSMDVFGYVTLRDRSKDLIISGGTNIYPREVEEVLLLHPAVQEVSVIGQADPEWGESVVAFVVAKPVGKVTEAELDELCLQHIARFKRPKLYHFIAELPKNNYGKVLKTRLREIIAEGVSA